MSDLLFFAGGNCLARHGTLVWQTTAEEDTSAETHTRSSTARSKGQDGYLHDVDTNVPTLMWHDHDGDGVREPFLLIEGERTNLNTEDDLSAWTTSGTITVTGSVADPAEGTGAYTVSTSSGGSSTYIARTISPTSATVSVSWIVAENSMPGAGSQDFQLYDTTAATDRIHLKIASWSSSGPSVSAQAGTLIGTRELAGGYYQIQAYTDAVVTGNTNQLRLFPAANNGQSGSFDVYRLMAYDDKVPLMSVVDEGATHQKDVFYAPFPHPPQELTVYIRFDERGSIEAANKTLVHIGSATATADPRFIVARESSVAKYSVTFDNGTTVNSANGNNLTTPVFNDVVELVATLNSSGNVQISQSINGGAIDVGQASNTTATIPSAWAGERIYIGSRGSSGTTHHSVVALSDLKIARGIKTMSQMRAL
ncbi:MAG: hypothetical protein VW547_01255 [Alphaproteobacteria bacterium]